MRDHDGEEKRVKPWKGAVEACNKTPRQGKVEIAGIVDLPSIAVWGSSYHQHVNTTIEWRYIAQLTPPVNQDRVASVCFYGSGVLDILPWQLRERMSLNNLSALLMSEVVFLAISRIPDPVYKEVRNRECQ